MKYHLLLFFLTFSTTLFAQNQELFFKMLPHLEGGEPVWVQQMYSENPNVYEVIDLYEAFYKTNDFEKNIHTQNYKHWLKNVASYLNDEGYIQFSNPKKDAFVADLLKQRKQESLQKSNDIWTTIGPYETYANDGTLGVIPVSWQVNVYCLDQSVSNPNVLYAGTEGMGAWKTTDKGLNWFSITKNEDIRGVTDIKVAPTDENLVYLAGGGQIYKSTDGGVTWTGMYTLSGIYQIIIHPSNPDTVLVVGTNGLHKTTDGGASWTQQYSTKCWDINFHPTNPSIVYLLRHNSSLQYTEFWKSTDTGATWNQVTNTWYDPTDATFPDHIDYGALIAVTPLEPNKVYVGMMGNHKADDNVWIGVYRSEDAGESWVNPIQDGGPYTDPANQNLATSGRTGGFSQTFYDFGFDASHTVPGKLYIGVLSLSVSSDSGNSWLRIGGYSPAANVGWIHPDIQDIHVLGGDVWVATDGGINYSNDEFTTHQSRKNGIVGTHFWGLDQGWNQDVLVGGRYHNGNTALFEAYGVGNSTRLGGGEAPTGYVDLMNPLKSYFSDISTCLISPTTVGINSNQGQLGKYPHESYFHAASSEIVRDPRYAHHLYIGASTGVQNGGFWKSEDNGASFELLYDFGTAKVTGIEISRQDPNVLYCVYNGSTIYKTIDGGHSWTATASLPTSGSKLISINPADDQELWAFANTGNNTNKVFRTTNGGTNWDNMTTATLSGHTINDGFFQGGSVNSRVYVVSAYGLFYWDSATSDWVDYHLGLPFVMGDVKNIFKPFYRDSKIRLSSVRGVWEAPFQEPSLPLAFPMTISDTVFCTRDTVQFDCHSILDHNGATWQWMISPAPVWLSSTTARNPKALLADGTSYDVTLIVTDGNGNTDAKIVSNMVTVASQCEAEVVPGLAVETFGDGDWVQTPSLNFTSNTVTMTAWVKPNGIQPEYSSIVMNDGTSAGFNFREANNTLAYHWPGGAWWWDSGLEVPSGVWSHVAMVATPTSMTVYVNGVGSTHNTNLDPADLGTLKIGSYKAWGGRNYKGLIDEVCIWNRSLTQAEIRELRHLTKVPQTDPNIVAYYQFNKNDGSALDRANVYHANLSGGATKVVSTAPFGGGVSHRTSVNAGGTYSFGDTGMSLTFPATGTYPNGELVVSRIDLLPNVYPTDNPVETQNLQQYWIVNNYGNNTTFSALENVQFTPTLPNVALQGVTNSAQISLYKRSDNEDQNNWTNECGAANMTTGTSGFVAFDNTCSLTSFSQFFLTTPTIPVKIKAFLEGAYNSGSGLMTTQLNNDLLPLSQPYNQAPWNYTGVEQIANLNEMPADMVDWVLVEARDPANDDALLTAKAALLLADGTVRDIETTDEVYLSGLQAATNYRFVLRHRNHLDVLTATAFILPNATPYDFTLAQTQAAGFTQLTDLGDGSWGLYSGDISADGILSVTDYNMYVMQAAAVNMYLASDVNLDRNVTTADFNFYLPNSSIIGVEQIRY